MKQKNITRILIGAGLVLTTLAPGNLKLDAAQAEETGISPSQMYVKAMGQGWNLGNTFDSINPDVTQPDNRENSWGNPTVTAEFIRTIKGRGFSSIRIPMTLNRRYTETNGVFTIGPDWIKRYQEVVQYALDAGLYVLINMHHDSWIWLNKWDGNAASKEYAKIRQLWTQLAEAFKSYPKQVCFETINEPSFSKTGNISEQNKLDMINLAAYTAIRKTGGLNATRMIVLPTLHTSNETNYSMPLLRFVKNLKDENIIATVHYYSDWVFSINLGKSGFDEVLWEKYTPRKGVDSFYDKISGAFIAHGIGVIVGEYGLLGYDVDPLALQSGEELKYYEYMNALAKKNGVCLMFWDNGSGIDRKDVPNYAWKKPLVGKMLESCIRGERSSYAAGLNTIYLSQAGSSPVGIPLTLNGNSFTTIEGLTEGVDYTWDAASSNVSLSPAWVQKAFNGLAKKQYGVFADLVMHFSSGADWHQDLVKFAAPVFSKSKGTTKLLSIPVKFNGSSLRRASARSGTKRVGPNSGWWQYLQYGSAFEGNYTAGTIDIMEGFFKDSSVTDGDIAFEFEFYDGRIDKYYLVKKGTAVYGSTKERK